MRPRHTMPATPHTPPTSPTHISHPPVWRCRTWKKRYTILSGNVLYYFKSPKDKAPAGFVPLESIVCNALADGCTFEIRPVFDDGKGIKSVKMERQARLYTSGPWLEP